MKLSVLTHSGVYTATDEERSEQIEQFDMYKQADNFAGWLYKAAIMDGMHPNKAEAFTLDVLKNGSATTIDVRY